MFHPSDYKKLIRAVERIEQRWPQVAPVPQERDRDAIAEKALRHVVDWDWPARQSLMTAAARAAFDDVRRERASLAPLRDFLIREVAASSRPGFLGALSEVYLESFVPGAPHSLALAESLAEARPRLSSRWAKAFDALPELLDARSGPARIAQRMVASSEPFTMLKAAGLRFPHRTGFMDHAHTAFVDALKPGLTHDNGAAFAHLCAWLRTDDGKARTAGADEALKAVLTPWRDHDPSEAYKVVLLRELVALYGDPRLGRGDWHNTGEAKAPLLRWLAAATQELFWQIISRADNSHMVPQRRAFWLQMFEEGRISEAWFALSEKGELLARALAKQTSGGILASFGRQTHGGHNGRCLLIMRVGQNIVVEGSSNYKVHIFNETCKDRPKLYLGSYNCESIRRTLPEKFKKTHDQYGNWQQWVRQQL